MAKVEGIFPKGHEMVGFYSPAKKIDIGDSYLVFVSGVQAHDTSANIENQTRQVFEDIGNILKSAGASFDDIVKAVIYVTDMKDFEIVSAIRADYFKKSRPASTLIEVNRMVRDGAKIEIEVTALLEK